MQNILAFNWWLLVPVFFKIKIRWLGNIHHIYDSVWIMIPDMAYYRYFSLIVHLHYIANKYTENNITRYRWYNCMRLVLLGANHDHLIAPQDDDAKNVFCKNSFHMEKLELPFNIYCEKIKTIIFSVQNFKWTIKNIILQLFKKQRKDKYFTL